MMCRNKTDLPTITRRPFFRRAALRHLALGFSVLLSATGTVSAMNIGEKVPECVLKKMDASKAEVDLRHYQGRVLYLDFWASWCGPCAKSFPYMNSLESTLKDKGLQIVGVNLDEDIEDAESFLSKVRGGFTVARDTDQACAQRFAVQAMPSTYVIDRKGIVRHIHLGFRAGETDELRASVDRLLAEPE